MQPKVKSTKEVLYNSELQKTGIVNVVMTNWREEQNGSFIAEVEKTGTDSNGVTETIHTAKPVAISAEMYNQLMAAIKPIIPQGLTPQEERHFCKQMALLSYVKNDFLEGQPGVCIFGLSPTEFEVAE